MSVEVSEARFEELVADALDQVPPDLAALMDNVVVLIEPRSTEEPDILGLYDGTPLPERDGWYTFREPDRIFIFRDPLIAMCEDEEHLTQEVLITVVHEIAHHFGIDDDRLHELGWG
ncbi:metallopeptidase family protein [Alteromonas gracilis]